MTNKVIAAVALVCLSAGWLRADFSYHSTTKITGGAMVGLLGAVGGFSRGMREAQQPTESDHYLKGNRMVTMDRRAAHIIDLDKQTMTEINFEKKTYSVITFAQMAEAFQKMSQQMAASMQEQRQKAQAQGAEMPEMNVNVDVKETGQRKTISGLDTHEVILTTQFEMTDPRTGQKGVTEATSDLWLASSVPGYDEVRAFYQKMALNMAGSMNAAMGGMAANPMFGKAAAKLASEGQKLQGVHVLQIMRFGGPGTTVPTPAGTQQTGQQQQQQQQQTPAARDAAGQAAAGAALGRLGRLGGIGGLGGARRKKDDAPPPPPPQAGTPGPAPDASASGVLMETTTESSNFSSAPVDASKFEVPGSFKQEEHPMLRYANRK
jgi:hypothetical protein